MRRMRTINEAIGYIKELDKDTAVTNYCIRAICVAGKIYTVQVGKKWLLDLDELLNLIFSSSA